jgi:hypothetical protein
MKNQTVIGLDFGSAYTKVGWRGGWDQSTALLSGLRLSEQGQFTVPTIAAQIKHAGKSDWVFGASAARQPPSRDVLVYRNWKSALLNESRPPAEWPDSTHVSQVAFQYFLALGKDLARKLNLKGIGEQAARICIPGRPAIKDVEGAELFLAEILEAAGWRLSEVEPFVSEPLSNLIGIVTSGRNATWQPPPISFQPHYRRTLQLDKMIEAPGLKEAVQSMSSHYDVLVVDVGAFTTDFGIIRIDTSFNQREVLRTRGEQESVDVGIRQLDEAVIDSLSTKSRDVLRNISWAEWDQLKSELYAGRPQQVLASSGHYHVVGAGKDAENIQHEISRFTDRISAEMHRFRSRVRGVVQAEALSGGGTFIPSVRAGLWGQDASAETMWKSIKRLGGAARQLDDRTRKLMSVVRRGGTALGACSVFFERNCRG